MRIVVMGSGGTGGYFGAKLARAGEDVTFVARGAHLTALRADGLRIKSAIEGEWSVRAPRWSGWRARRPRTSCCSA
ncbi:MAG: ketopantoate reductase family protein [Candidatus Rokuibacteriota bacterium]